jgi:DNA-directed RNA polymerase subunit B"
MMQNLEESECDSVESGIMYRGKKLAPNQTKDYHASVPNS